LRVPKKWHELIAGSNLFQTLYISNNNKIDALHFNQKPYMGQQVQQLCVFRLSYTQIKYLLRTLFIKASDDTQRIDWLHNLLPNMNKLNLVGADDENNGFRNNNFSGFVITPLWISLVYIKLVSTYISLNGLENIHRGAPNSGEVILTDIIMAYEDPAHRVVVNESAEQPQVFSLERFETKVKNALLGRTLLCWLSYIGEKYKSVHKLIV
jgi:hypothetical protein